MSLRSPRSPTGFSRQGFQPLDNTANMNYDSDIPLTTVRTASSTGARRAGDEAMVQQPTFRDDEKKHIFNRGRRRVKKTNSRPKRVGTDGEEVSVNALGVLYDKIVNFSIVTRYIVYVAPVALLIAAPIIIYAILDHKAIFATTGIRVIWFWTWIETIWLSLWVSKLVAKAIPWVFMFLCGVVSSGTRKYALILKAVEIPLSLVGWTVTIFVTFTALTQKNINNDITNKHWVSVVRQLLGPCLIASLLFLGEKVIIQLISVGYHRRSFDGRIKQSKRDVHLVGLLYEASRTLFPMYCEEFLEEDYVINDSIEAMLAKTTGKMGHRRSGSATPLRIIGDVGRLGDKVTSVFGNIASEITGKQVFNPNSAHSVVVEALEKTRSSEALAKRLWMSFVVEGKEVLYVDDVREVLGPARKDEADEAFAALDQDANGDISLDEMIMKIVEIGRDRKSISHSMRDVGQAIGVLDQILLTVLLVIIVFIFVAFQDTNFVTTLATAGTTLLSLSFVFAATTQEFLGSCIFLFVKHPFDVGDRVDIVGPVQEFLVVEQISLLYTVFKRIDSMKMVQVPNIVLNTLWIENITRSKAMKEQLDMFISFDTSLEDIELLRREMEIFVRSADNARDFQPDIILEATGIGNMDKLQLKVEIRHKSNWHNETVRAARRSKFMCALVLALRKIPIYGPGGGGEALGGATNPSYSVAVSDTLAAEAREKAAEAKEAKRLVPTPAPKVPSGDLGTETEMKSAEILNTRNPTADAAHSEMDKAAWNSEEDNTLNNSRDVSLERHRSVEIDTLREGLIKRQSTRGRRRPGEAMPAIITEGGPGFTLTSASPNRNGLMGSDQTLDEEAEMGLEPTTSAQGYTTYQGQNQSHGGYSIYPPPSAGSRGAQVPQAGAPPQGRLRRLSLGLKPSNSLRGAGPS